MSRVRYLNGIDWVIHGLDQSIRQTSGFGNGSQIVFELAGKLDFESFRTSALTYASAFPVLQGRAVRGWQLAPVWKIPRRLKTFEISVQKHLLPDDASFERIVEKLGTCVTAPPGTPGHYIAFSILYAANKSYLAFRFDHRLFDAHGAELFIQGLLKKQSGGHGMESQKSNLRPWVQKFKSGQQVLRMFRDCQVVAPLPSSRFSSTFRFTVISLNQEESDALVNRAYKDAGYLMLTPWLAARFSDLMIDTLGKGTAGQVIPCAVDRRADAHAGIFFNHVSFIYFARAAGEENCPKRFSQQLVDQVQRGMSDHLENAWKLARIIPVSLYGKLLRGALKKFAGTFNLAYVGDGLSSIQSIAGHTVENVFHMPMVPPAPGLGFFVNTFQGRLNICCTSSGCMFSDEEHARLAERLRVEISMSCKS